MKNISRKKTYRKGFPLEEGQSKKKWGYPSRRFQLRVQHVFLTYIKKIGTVVHHNKCITYTKQPRNKIAEQNELLIVVFREYIFDYDV